MTAPRLFASTLAAALLMATLAAPSFALDAEHRAKAEAAIAKATAWLKSQQSAEGSWSPKYGPAVTGLIVAGMLDGQNPDPTDPALAKAIDYILAHQKPDGGIYDQILGNYNTSICLMALGRLPDQDKVAPNIKKAQDYLRNLQWAGQEDPDGETIDPDHRWYGGAGYGGHGRPDLSNTATMIAGLHDSGLVCTDPAYVRAMSFISQLQGTKTNTKFGDQIEPGGGFIYSVSQGKDKMDQLETKAGTVVDSTGKSRLRTYGSMTYAGFMSYLYAELDRDDSRVQDAYNWLRRNYTLQQNPGMVDDASTQQDERRQGYYYYMHMLSRALNAWGDPTITDADGNKHNWPNELIDKLVSLQKSDGHWINDDHPRWAEADPNLATAYAILALQHALQ
ncbi:hypothetical protein HED60_07380 [Planctomycetales bacterium ZRK34]|nr:hypothetical protein HED60_07380 [Planctomycetales bacterium ZRK34]